MFKKIFLFCFLCFNMFLLVGCGGPLDAVDQIKYDGDQITWNEVKQAKEYQVIINGQNVATVNTNKYNYDGNGLDFTCEIVAVAKKAENNSQPFAVNFKPLGQVTNIRYENGALKWDLVEGANAYVVKVNNVVDPATTPINEYTKLKPGSNAIQIKAIVEGDDSYYSKWSTQQIFKFLAAPETIKYDKENNKIKWSEVYDASAYMVRINDGEPIKVQGTEMPFEPLEKGQLKIEVLSYSETAGIYSSAYSKPAIYNFLAPINGVQADSGDIIWESIGEKSRYEVEVTYNGIKTLDVVSTPRYSKLEPGKNYTVRVRALPQSDNEFSVFSDPIKVYFLSVPNIDLISSDGEDKIGFSFTATNGETEKIESYQILIKDNQGNTVIDQSVPCDSNSMFNAYDFKNVGEYTVQVKAKPKTLVGNYEFDSKYSDPIKVVRLEEVSGIRLKKSTNESYDCNVEFNSFNAPFGYSYYINTTLIKTTNDNNFPLNLRSYIKGNANATVDLSIKANGGGNVMKNGKYYLASYNNTTQTITKLAAPTEVSLKKAILGWTEVSSAESYTIDISGDTQIADTNSHSIAIVTPGKHIIKVKAMGNLASFVVDSEYSEQYVVTKLDTPVVRLDMDGILSFNTIASCSGYQISAGNHTTKLEDSINTYDINEYINTENAIAIFIKALGNDAEIIDSEPSSAINVMKLAKPKNLGVVNQEKEIRWDGGVNAKDFRVNLIQSGNIIDQQLNLNATNYKFTKEAGEYSLTVRANGYTSSDAKHYYINSSEETLTFSKLDKMELTYASTTDYTWNEVIGNNGYMISIPNRDDIPVHDTKYTPVFDTKDVNTTGLKIKFKALGNDNANMFNSDEVVVTQLVKRIQTPIIKLSADNEKVVATAKSNMDKLAKYVFAVGNSEKLPQELNVLEYTPTEPGKFTFKVKMAGNIFDNKIYYLDSEYSTEQSITVLRPIKDLTSLVQGGAIKLTWKNTDNKLCQITYQINGGEEVVKTGTESLTIKGVKSGDVITVKIFVKGNGVNIFNSTVVEETFNIN